MGKTVDGHEYDKMANNGVGDLQISASPDFTRESYPLTWKVIDELTQGTPNAVVRVCMGDVPGDES